MKQCLTLNRVYNILVLKAVLGVDDKEIIRELIKNEKLSNCKLAKKLNYTTASGVSEKLRRKESMRLDTFVKFLSAMGGSLVVRHGDSEYEVSFDVKPEVR